MSKFKKIVFYIFGTFCYGLLIGAGFFSVLSACSILFPAINRILIIVFHFALFLVYLKGIRSLSLRKDKLSKVLLLIFILGPILFASLIYLWIKETITKRNYSMDPGMISCRQLLVK